jgi:hypothetical protein
MTYSEAIKGGFRLINRKWQLIAVQAGMMLFNCVSFFVLVGIPLGIAFIMFGLDLTGLAELNDLMGMLKDPAALLSKYFGLVLTVLICLLVYIVLVTLVGLYVFSGSIGTLGRSLLEPSPGFSLRAFHREAKKLFSPLMWYSLVVGLVFIGITFVLGLLGGGVAVAVSSAKSYDSTLALFLGIFFSLVLVLIGLSVILVALAATVYGTAVLFFKREGSFRSFTEAVKFLWDKPHSFWLYVILLSGYVAMSFLVMLVVYPFNLIPIIGPVIAFPFQIVSYVVRGYLGLVLIAAVFIYYFDGEIKEEPAAPSAQYPADSTAGHSEMDEDISFPEDPGPETTPPEKAE